MTYGLANHHHLAGSSFILGASGVVLIFTPFSDKFPLSKQNSPRLDAAFCGVPSGAILFACVP